MSRLYNFGLYVHDNRKTVVVFAVASLLFSVGLLSQGEEFIDGNAPPPTTDSGRALILIDEQLTVSASNSVTYILSHQERRLGKTKNSKPRSRHLSPPLEN